MTDVAMTCVLERRHREEMTGMLRGRQLHEERIRLHEEHAEHARRLGDEGKPGRRRNVPSVRVSSAADATWALAHRAGQLGASRSAPEEEGQERNDRP